MFSASRLAVARKRRQMTKKDLAARAGVSAVHLTRLESGRAAEPASDTVAALASALRYPVDFFHLPDCDELPLEAVSFRSLSSLSARQRDAALAGGAIAFDLYRWTANRFTLPEPDLPDMREDESRAAAGALRSHWGVGSRPIGHIVKLLEAKGVRVFTLAEQHKNVDAFSCWHDGVPFVFLNTFKSAERSRFDAAHELGHLVLHVGGVRGDRDAEREADNFASAFLVPRGDLIGNLPRAQTLDQLIAAKARWGVSVAALARAAFDVGLISEWHYRDLCKWISMRGYRKTEPREMPRERSVLWQKVFEALWTEGRTRDAVARELCLPRDEIDALIGELVAPAPVRPIRKTPQLSVV